MLFRLVLLIVLLFVLFSKSVVAQEKARVPPVSAKTTTFAKLLDANRSLPSPLLLTLPILYQDIPLEYGDQMPMPKSLLALSRDLQKQVIKAGSVTVLTPLKMSVINTAPGKARIFEGLNAGDRLKLLFASFSEAQWQRAGSAAGLGIADLTDDQRPLFLSFISPTVEIRETVITHGDAPDAPEQEGVKVTNRPGTDLRLHLSRALAFEVNLAGIGRSSPLVSTMSPKAAGKVIQAGLEPENQKGKVFGQTIIGVVPASRKPSQINFDAPVLNRMVPLQNIRQVGDLIGRIAAVTNQPITADNRIIDLPLYCKGSEARAGDLLLALADMVCGAYRLVCDPNGDHVYHLTDDIEGIGPRLLRLSKWGEDAWVAQITKLQGVVEEISKKNPIRFISFDANDPFSAPPSVAKEIEKAWAEERYSTPSSFAVSDLPAPIRDRFFKMVSEAGKEGYHLPTDHVGLSMQLKLSWVVPGIGTLEDIYSPQGLGSGFLKSIVPVTTKASTPKVAVPPHSFPAALVRRMLLVAPATAEEAVQIVKEGKQRGFSDVWIQVPCDPNSASLLNKAVQAGKAAHIAVGGAVSLLHETAGEQEYNIAGEQGEAITARLRLIENHMTNGKYAVRKASGWVIADSQRLTAVLSTLAKVRGLSALVLRATAAPGYVGDTPGADGFHPGMDVGYSVANRLIVIRKRGFDPIDVAQIYFLPNFHSETSLFTFKEPMLTEWFNFRQEQNRALLRDLYATIRKNAPTVPLFLSDRSNDFTEANLSWYGSWDSPDSLPKNPIYFEEQVARTAAQSASKTVFLNATHWRDTNKPDAPADFGQFVNKVSETAMQHWKGLVLDLTAHPTAETLRLIGGIPVPSAPKESEP